MPDKVKYVRLTNDTLNSYGSRVLTAGMDIEQYQRNPVLLDMHERGNVIGYVQNLERREGEIVGELVFDEASELSRQRKAQYEKGSIRMVSVGIDIVEMSDDPATLVVGQTRPTITKSKLFEVSLVDIGANNDAIVLRKDGNIMSLSADGLCPLPTLKTEKKIMEEKEELEKLNTAVATLTKERDEAASQIEALSKERDEAIARAEAAESALIERTVDAAITDSRILATKREQFVTLGKKIGISELEMTLGAINAHKSVSAEIKKVSGNTSYFSAKDWDRMDKDGTLYSFKKNEPDAFKELYKTKFGKEYTA